MSYLSTLIGRVITIDLNKEAKQDKMMKLFYETDRNNDGFIGNKLLGVDSNGIWLEGFKDVTRFIDKDGQPIPENLQKTENVTVSVFIPFSYLSGMAVINDKSFDEKIIGFN